MIYRNVIEVQIFDEQYSEPSVPQFINFAAIFFVKTQKVDYWDGQMISAKG